MTNKFLVDANGSIALGDAHSFEEDIRLGSHTFRVGLANDRLSITLIQLCSCGPWQRGQGVIIPTQPFSESLEG